LNSADKTPLVAIDVFPPAPPSIERRAVPPKEDASLPWGTWKAPPRRRRNITDEARLGAEDGHKVHLTVDFDDAGKPCAIAVAVHKEGSVFRGMLDTAAALASQALQHGASMAEVANRLIGVRFEPSGSVCGHESIEECLSLVDLLGQMLARVENLEPLNSEKSK